MKKNAKIVYIISAFTTIFATIFAIISLSYAWYNRQNNAGINSVTMSAAGFSGIQLSGDGISWKSQLTSSDIDFDENLEIDSVSTSAQVIDGNLQFYKAAYGNSGFETTLLTEPTLYYVFDFFVLNNDLQNKMLKLGYNSTVVDNNNKDLAVSARVAFLNLGTVATSEELSTLDGTGIDSVDYIWEPNSTTRNKRVNLYHTIYHAEGKSPYQGVAREATNLGLVNSLIVDSVETPEPEVVDVTTYDPQGAGEKNEITLIAQAAITKIRVYIWAEGQDIDCTNSITGGTANINLNFNTQDVQQNLEGDYVAVESFYAPTISASSALSFVWNATSTNLSTETFSSNYIVRISTMISSELIIIRTILTNQLEIDITELSAFLLGGEYYIDVRVYSQSYGNSVYSNQLSFDVFQSPSDIMINTSILSWSAVTDAINYTIKVIDKDSLIEYTAITNLISNDLTTTLFNGTTYLPSGHEYFVSVKTNATLLYAESAFSQPGTWEN